MTSDFWQFGGGFLGFVVLVLDLIVLFEVINSNRSLGGKLGWSASVFFSPVVGLIA